MGRQRRELCYRQSLHLKRIAREHSIDLHWTKHRWDAESWPSLNQAVLPKIRNTGDYLLGLHELGHILSPEARRFDEASDPHSALLCEGAAWAWAMDNALPELLANATDQDWATVGEAIVSHYRWAGLSPKSTEDEGCDTPADSPEISTEDA